MWDNNKFNSYRGINKPANYVCCIFNKYGQVLKTTNKCRIEQGLLIDINSIQIALVIVKIVAICNRMSKFAHAAAFFPG